MSGDVAGAAMGQQGTADQASGQEGAADQASGKEGTGQQGAGWEGAVNVTIPQSPEELSRAGWQLPWAESPTTGAGPPERTELEVAFATAMRRTGPRRPGP